MSRAAALYLRFPYDPSLLHAGSVNIFYQRGGATLSIIKNNSFMTDDATPLRTFQNILCFVIKDYILYDR